MVRVYFELDCPHITNKLLAQMKKVVRRTVEEVYPKHRLEVDIIICGDERVRELNRDYRGIDRTTDVLSFPQFEFDTPDTLTHLGDIVISYNKACAQAEEYGHSATREFCFLAAHSALHLIGYDHETDEERVIMEQKQKEILDSLGIVRE